MGESPLPFSNVIFRSSNSSNIISQHNWIWETNFFFLLVTVEVLFIKKDDSSHKIPTGSVSPVTVTSLTLLSTCFPSRPSCMSHCLSRFQGKQTENSWSLLSELKEELQGLYSIQPAEIQRRNSVIKWESHTSWAITPGASLHIKLSWMGSAWYRNWKVWSCKQALKLK